MIRKAVSRLLVLLAAGVILGAFLLLIVMPQLDWSAMAKPPVLEKRLAGLVLHRWVRRNAPAQSNPIPASADNLRAGRAEFVEHCAVCHSADGSAHTPLGADFYPPIARLERGAPGWSDGELYFIIANGIRYTGMPGFGAHHEPADLWRMILWIRHLPHLTDEERTELRKRAAGAMEHDEHDESVGTDD
jgi:mono/diheme cytochrome c family protein